MTENITPERTAQHQPVQQPQYPAPQHGGPGQWQAAVHTPAASGYRVTAGIVSLVLSFVLGFDSLASFAAGNILAALVISLASLGTFVSGITILVLQGQRLGSAPKVVVGMALFGLLASLIGAGAPMYGPFLAMLVFLLAVVVLEATSRGLAKEKQHLTA